MVPTWARISNGMQGVPNNSNMLQILHNLIHCPLNCWRGEHRWVALWCGMNTKWNLNDLYAPFLRHDQLGTAAGGLSASERTVTHLHGRHINRDQRPLEMHNVSDKAGRLPDDTALARLLGGCVKVAQRVGDGVDIVHCCVSRRFAVVDRVHWSSVVANVA